MLLIRARVLGALIWVTLSAESEAQSIPTTVHIEITGAIRQQRGGYGKFEFQSPHMVVVWLNTHSSYKGILSLQMRRRGAGFVQAGRYGVGPGGPNHGPPEDSTLFEGILQYESRMWTMDSGHVTIERADTLEMSGQVSLRGVRPSTFEGRPPSDSIWVEARFTVRYDPFNVEMRQRLHDRAEPHPPSRGRRSPRRIEVPASEPHRCPPAPFTVPVHAVLALLFT